MYWGQLSIRVLTDLVNATLSCFLSVCVESPQAANPGCSLEDFVRWYSPRDYVVEEVTDETGQTVVRGNLSARMKIPGNMWVEAWETAKATPARRQRRLFDDTKEAERVQTFRLLILLQVMIRDFSVRFNVHGLTVY